MGEYYPYDKGQSYSYQHKKKFAFDQKPKFKNNYSYNTPGYIGQKVWDVALDSGKDKDNENYQQEKGYEQNYNYGYGYDKDYAYDNNYNYNNKYDDNYGYNNYQEGYNEGDNYNQEGGPSEKKEKPRKKTAIDVGKKVIALDPRKKSLKDMFKK